MQVKLHDIGEGMTEASINCFLVQPGDLVKADDPLLEVQTDKMTAEIPAPGAGIVREFSVNAGDTVPVGTTLLILELVQGEASLNDNEIPAAASNTGGNEGTVIQKEPFTNSGLNRILASPFTRKIARDQQVNIELVTGSGPGGRITDKDVYSFIKQKELPAKQTATLENDNKTLDYKEKTVEIETIQIPFRGRRRMIAKNLAHSLRTIPHCTHFEEIDVTELIQFRSELKKLGTNISATAFFLKALSISLKAFPVFNAELDEERETINLLKEHHFGVAVDTEDGLIVPVVKSVEKKTLKMIHEEMKELTQKALVNELSMQEILGGTFTISNVGPLGGSIGATPIIQHPQTALVSFHKTKKMPVVTDDDQIVIRSIMNLSMSFDHRVADGATAVKFTNMFSDFIKNPKLLLLELI